MRTVIVAVCLILATAPAIGSPNSVEALERLAERASPQAALKQVDSFLAEHPGEYDALLPWPFSQAVTLTLVDQNKQRDIVQLFRPEPTSSSFQRPRNEMNVASGCPIFALVSVLDNVFYVKDDTLFLKCKVDTTGLTE